MDPRDNDDAAGAARDSPGGLSTRPAPLRPGDPRDLGDYRILGRLGEGGMGTVFLGRGRDTGLVAVKVIRADIARVPRYRERFRREAAAARRVARFCTAEVLDVVDPAGDGPPYLVTEFVDGPTLARAVAEHGPLGSADVERVAVSVAAALSAIHGAGLVHSDVTPSNVLLSPLGPRVIDFGLARVSDDGPTGPSRRIAGTPAFMAPEQARGHHVTSAADVFAWGGLVLFAATGRRPFGDGSTAEQLRRLLHTEPVIDGLPVELGDIVRAAMARDPARRPSAETLLRRLTRPGVAHETIVTSPLDVLPAGPPRPAPPTSRAPRPTSAADGPSSIPSAGGGPGRRWAVAGRRWSTLRHGGFGGPPGRGPLSFVERVPTGAGARDGERAEESAALDERDRRAAAILDPLTGPLDVAAATQLAPGTSRAPGRRGPGGPRTAILGAVGVVVFGVLLGVSLLGFGLLGRSGDRPSDTVHVEGSTTPAPGRPVLTPSAGGAGGATTATPSHHPTEPDGGRSAHGRAGRPGEGAVTSTGRAGGATGATGATGGTGGTPPTAAGTKPVLTPSGTPRTDPGTPPAGTGHTSTGSPPPATDPHLRPGGGPGGLPGRPVVVPTTPPTPPTPSVAPPADRPDRAATGPSAGGSAGGRSGG